MQSLRSILGTLVLVMTCPQWVGAATATIGSQAKVAPGIALTAVAPLDFGVLLIDSGLAGFYEIEESDGSETTSNAIQASTISRGEFTIMGRSGTNVEMAMVPTALTCDITFLNPCVGTPTLASLSDTFGALNQISNASCVGVRCTDTVYIGGRLDFTGTEEGRWTAVIEVTANYQ